MGKEKIKEKVVQVIEDVTDIAQKEIGDNDALMDDLDISSLEVMTIIGEIEDIFQIKVKKKEMQQIVTVNDVVDCIYRVLK
nr:phosphopantetheine-binding protein [uncultured Anaerostipes sp.]